MHNPVAFLPRAQEPAHRALQKFMPYPALLLGSLQACSRPHGWHEVKAFIDNLDNLPDPTPS